MADRTAYGMSSDGWGPVGPSDDLVKSDGSEFGLVVTLTELLMGTTLIRQLEQYVGLNTLAAASGFTVDLPATPTEGDRIWFKDQEINASINSVTIDGNGKLIDGLSMFTVNIDEQALMIQFTFGEWRIF
jgi:hypothetical protein